MKKKMLQTPPRAIKTLGSAGKISLNDAGLTATRHAFFDADRAAGLALLYSLTGQSVYLNKTRDILLNWAMINEPTGHPIDETRLEGLLWAYDLTACMLSQTDRQQIEVWLTQLRAKKIAWKFGTISGKNNHRIHQLKMLLMLDKLLHLPNAWHDDLTSAQHYAALTIDPNTGMTTDYQERRAIYYHNYVLQPWYEIVLISGCCQIPVTKAFDWMANRVLTDAIHNEFIHSKATIDALRSDAGFSYAKTGGTFDIYKAAPTIVSHYSLTSDRPSPDLWTIVNNAKPSPWLAFLKARRLLWHA